MKFRFLVFILSLICIVYVSIPAVAQQNEDEEAAMLPNIDPQNIEIRGEFKARFPGLERQPILGFDPTMRIYQVPANRKPFIETGKSAVASLPVSEFSRPAPPGYVPLTYSDINYMFARAGLGNYQSGEVQFWAAVPLSDRSYIGADVNYTGSIDGHLEERPSSYRYLTANLEFGTRLSDNLDLHLYGGGQNDFNYAARFNQSNNLDEIARITFEGIHAGAALMHFKNEVTGWKLQGGVRTFTTTFESEYLPGKIDEMVFNGSFAYRWALGHPGETIAVQVGGRGGTYETGDLENQQWTTVEGGVTYERLFNYNTKIYAEADLYYTSNYIEETFYPGGLLKISHWFGNRIKITGSVKGKPYLQTVEQNHEINRFLGYNNNLRHTYAIHITGKAFIKYYRGSRLHGGVTYMRAQNYAYFLPESINNPIGPEQFDFYSLHYQDATNMKLFAGITHQLSPGTFWISAEAYVQNPVLSNDEPIPYKSNWGVNASATFRPIDRITIRGWTNYIADREPGLEGTELDNIFLVGGQLDVEIVDQVGAYIKAINLLDYKYQYWQGYRERPMQIYAGITINL